MERARQRLVTGRQTTTRGRPRTSAFDDIWHGVDDPRERKRIQDRLAQRARRERINQGSLTVQRVATLRTGLNDEALPQLDRSISLSEVNRAQVLADFLMYYCSGKDTVGAHERWLRALPSTAVSSTLLTQAIDVICFAHMSSTKHDSRVTHKAELAYARVLNSLRFSLQLPANRLQALKHRDLLVGMLTISYLGRNFGLSGYNDAWCVHWTAAHQFAAIGGPRAYDMTDHLTASLIESVFTTATDIGIARRTALPLSHSWTNHSVWQQPCAINLYGAKCQWPVTASLPTLLERTDKLLGHEGTMPDSNAVAELCKDIEHVRWSIARDGDDTLAEAASRTIAVTDTNAFDLGLEEHCFICTTDTISDFYYYDDLNALLLRMRSSTYQLVLACTLLRIIHFCPEMNLVPGLPAATALKLEAHKLAIQTCRSVYQVSLLETPARSLWLRNCISLALNVFEEQKAQVEVLWCRACLAAINTHLDRMLRDRVTRPWYNACRIATVPTAFMETGSYMAKRPSSIRVHVEL